MKESVSGLTITAVEREVGLSKDVLRVWERRYGFPSPMRDAHGERLYPPEQVRRLRLIKRLLDQGLRPGRLLGGTAEELEALASGAMQANPSPLREGPDDAGELLGCLRAHDAAGLYRALQQRLAQIGLASFVQDAIAPLATRVGEEWARGDMEVFEEHLFTEVATRLLRQGIAAVPPGQGPVVLLTTVPEEAHSLGLLMGEAMLSLRGAHCINLGTQVPLMDIARAAGAYGADVVALSFSSGFTTRRIPELLHRLRGSLPRPVRLWAAGAAVCRLRAIEGVDLLGSMDEALSALDACVPAAEQRPMQAQERARPTR
ncbi:MULTISPECIES: MerR family transcriptional regulator [Ramlibacter]|uniref:MerR family transcriptional regulator n=1 Tax=Ramlibacter pinisoli TaxID=2682844 RepID=A0A6N8ING5_9BURK|nr:MULTISPECIES: cobalamin B12-binding domain-containing protein [Ramlibacter]MBA2960528.1 cobalamin B12-binding domain-containing protein [Ramlibacter sp. CGMCC 1.13660]MVQ27860.1 MerR family transcriptional regulator [Ramlibacter pinisoli]